MFLLMFIGFY